MLTAFIILLLVVTIIATVLVGQGTITLLRVGVPYVSTPDWVVNWLASHLTLAANQLFVELGCGDGRTLIALARRFPTTRFVGYELNWWALLRARLNSRGLQNISFRTADFWDVSLTDADVVYCYLMTNVMERLSRKLQSEFKPGSRVYSYAFELPRWQATGSVQRAERAHSPSLWFYQC